MPSRASKPDKPSTLLRAMAQSMPDDAFKKVLSKNIYSRLDSLPLADRQEVFQVLEGIKQESDNSRALLSNIGFERHKKNLEARVKALLSHLRKDWKHGWQKQGDMMMEIATEVAEWFQLWLISVDQGVEIALIHKCVALCMDSIKKV
ncbi:hypothetical protein JAAARDRAFT_39224 [Jaapia argillacea MUCL 33604]|uniref:Uncharacterized protein n=1 Tax=Jaapia argillacea MUCL 33604 TaxID=933084 RepID=A0A067PFJ6_9AGAM|nr:hypothetical protein JAAARDRAFT_39224 [Jaapia argillacea MUCL 33604]